MHRQMPILGALGVWLAATSAAAQPQESAVSEPKGMEPFAASYASLPISQRLVGTWQLRKHSEKERLYIRGDGTFEWTMPVDDAHVTLAGEWDLIERTIVLIYGNENLRVTAGQVDAVTPRYLAFNYAGQKLMFERVARQQAQDMPVERSGPRGGTNPRE